MRIKKEYLILLFLIIILGIYLWRHNTDRINYELPQPQKINQQDIAKLDLSRSKSGISLVRRDGKWYIAQQDFRADQDKVQKILDTIGNIEISTLISKSGTYKRYKLDKPRFFSIKAFDDSDQLLRELRIGKGASGFNNNYVRLQDDPRIYLAKTPVSRDFGFSASKLRDKTVLAFSRQNIDTLILQNSERILAERTSKQPEDAPKEVSYWKGDSGEKLDKDKVSDLFNQLRELQCSSYYTKNSKKEMTSFDFKVKLQGNKEHFLELYMEQGKGGKIYKGRSSYTEYPFKLKDYTGKQIRDTVKSLLGE